MWVLEDMTYIIVSQSQLQHYTSTPLVAAHRQVIRAYCPLLTNLCFMSVTLEKSALIALLIAVSYSTRLTLLAFYQCEGLIGKFPLLFRSKWPTLSYLDLSETNINGTDLNALGNVVNVRTLGIYLSCKYSATKLRLNQFNLLETLMLTGVNNLKKVNIRQPQARLSELDIGHSSGISGHLPILLRHSFPSLNNLILSNCGLKS